MTRFNKASYFIFINILIFFIFLTTAIFIFAAVKLNHSSEHRIPTWLVSILTFIIPAISSQFFGQIFYSLLTIFYCNYETNSSFYSKSEECLQGIWFNIESVLCIIAMILLFCMAYVTNNVFYIPMCLKGKNKKIHSLNEVIFLITKVILNILFTCFKNNSDVYIFLILCNFTAWINYCCVSIYQGYSNKHLAFANTYLALVLLWGFLCLLIGNLIKGLIEFNGTSYLFIIGVILIFINTYYKSKLKNEIYSIDREKINSYLEYYRYIIELQNLIEQKNNSRENKIALKSFLMRIEENCTQSYCFLKRYLNCLEQGEDLDILLYYYMQKVFEDGLNKFNNNITITISYIYFLLKRLSKKKKAILLFKSINKNIYSIDKLFNIYRCEKIVESLWTGFDGKNKENIESADIAKLFDYQNNVKEFKELLNKISLLYYDFWLALFSNNCEGKDQFKQLNDIGTKINKLLYKIEKDFELIFSIKNDDVEILKLYSFYLKDILNDEERYIQYHSILLNISTDFNFNITEIDYTCYDINNLFKERKDMEYLIISADDNEKNERKILNMSLGLSSIIGYQKNEVIGKDMNILLPRLFHKFHNAMFKKLVAKRKIELYKALSSHLKYFPEDITKKVYCKTKSNFLKPLDFNAHLVQTEDGKHIFVALINRHSSFSTTWNEKGEAPPCCVLTDKNFIVQTFTADCCDLLGFNSSIINSNFEITSCILQFNEDIKNFQENSNFRGGGNSTYLFEVSEVLSNSTHDHGNHHKKLNKKSQKNIPTLSISRNNSSNKINNFVRPFHQTTDKMNVMKNRFKRQLIKTKYNSSQIITWKIRDDYNESKSIDNNYAENRFELSVKEIKILNNVIGYYFFFKKLKIMTIKRSESLEEINYYKQYVSNTIEEDDQSGENKSKEEKKTSSHYSNNSKTMNKSNTEYANGKSGFYLSQQILNKGKKLDENKINSNSKRISGISEEESKNFSFYLISGLKDENSAIEKKTEKELILYEQIIEKEREKKEIESRRFHNIEGTFVPKNYIPFDFDFESKSFLPSTKPITNKKKVKEKENELVSGLLLFYKKQLSELKAIQNKNENEPENNKSEYSSNISETSESGDSSSQSSEETKKEEEKTTNEGETKTPTLKPVMTKKKTTKDPKEIANDISSPKQSAGKNTQNKYSLKKVGNQNASNGYYKVKFEKIRYFYYDFYKEMVIEDKQYEKKSKIEKILEESKNGPFNLDKLHYYFSHSKDMEYNSIHKIDNRLKSQKLEGRHDSKKKDSKNIFDDDKKSSLADNEDEFKRKIKEALNKEDKQKSIEVFLIISILIFAFIIALGVLYNYSIILDINEDKQNIVLICYSAMLRTIYNGATYLLREFTLVNFLMPNRTKYVNYTQYPLYRNNRTILLKFMREKLRTLYMQSNNMLYILTSFDVKLSDNATDILMNNGIIISTVKENLTLYDINTTFMISLIELNSALYNLAISNVFIQQNISDIYIFIHNYQNEVGRGIRNQIDIFIEELNAHLESKKNKFIYQMVVVFILLILFFIILFICYKIIIRKKSSYIEGFYEIKLPFIRESLKNCEQFIYLLKKQKREEESGVENDKSSVSLQNEEDIDNQFDEEETKGLNTINKNLNGKYQNNKVNLPDQSNNRDSLSIIIFSVSIIIYFLVNIAFYLMSYFFYYFFTNDSNNYITYLFHLQRIQNNRMEFYNAYREYLFDENSTINFMNCETYIQLKSEEIYSTNGNDSYIINTMYDKIKNYKTKYEEFNSKSLCSRMEGDFFKNEEECENFLDGQISYGFGITSYTLLDLTRMGYNFVKYYYLDAQNITGNLSEYGKYEYEIKDNETFRLELFNNDTIHTNLNIIFLHALLPFYLGILNLTISSIEEAVANVDSPYLIIMICNIVINTILFLCIWIPFIKNMNSIIYNAKKILGIIPIHILATLSNIKRILELKKLN